MDHEPAVILFDIRPLAFAEDLKDVLLLSIGLGIDLGSKVDAGEIRGQPGDALVKPAVLLSDLAGQEFDKVSGIISIGGQASFLEKTHLFDRKVPDFDIGTKEQDFLPFVVI